MLKEMKLTPAPADFEQEALALLSRDVEVSPVASAYAWIVLAPPILAQRLRARGDARACARDFECPCLTSPQTDRPCCEKVFGDCRFAGDPQMPPPPGRSPRLRTFIDGAYSVAFAYKAATPAARTEMLAFMFEAIDERLRRYRRRLGKDSPRLPTGQPRNDEATARVAEQAQPVAGNPGPADRREAGPADPIVDPNSQGGA